MVVNMPFDVSKSQEAFFEAAPEQRLRMLVEALRNLPEDFYWNFDHAYSRNQYGCSGCAVGLMQHLWGTSVYQETSNWFGHFLPPKFPWHSTFYQVNGYAIAYQGVTPEMVANRIEDWLNS